MDFGTFLVRTLADICFNKPPKYETKDIWKQISEEQLKENSEVITQRVLKEMYCENTGSHICDSGGAYGYGYQRTQAVKDEDWMKFPYINVEIDQYSDGEYYFYVTKNSYQFLCEQLTYDLYMDKIFHKFCDSERTFQFKHKNSRGEEWIEYFEPKKESYYACMNAFINHLKHLEETFGFEDFEHLGGYNTYNGESCLDKTLQWEMFAIWNGKLEDHYIILQIHNGCDVRGGYSTPHVFKLDFDEFWCNIDDLQCSCPNFRWDNPRLNGTKQKNLNGKIVSDLKHVDCYSDDCGYHWYGNGGSNIEHGAEFKTDEKREHKIVCKLCGTELEFF